MDETNTANSSSAAAVADGASAAAHTKTIGTSAIKSSSHVKLLIKSSNQQHEDHVIESDLLWTVKRLKSHISLVYPSKPPADDQKLIYSGQLLSDNVQLKDVLRSYKDVYTHNHIIHLVYTPKNFSPLSTLRTNKVKTSLIPFSTTNAEAGTEEVSLNMSNNDGLRQRHAAGNNTTGQLPMSTTSQQQQPTLFQQHMYPYYMSQQIMSAYGTTCPQFQQNFVAQQAAMYNWMQQVYSQYMEQCLRLSYTSNDTATDATASADNNGTSNIGRTFPTFPPNLQQLFQQQLTPTVMTPEFQEIAVSSTASEVVAEASPVERQNQEQHPAQAQVAAQRFPNFQQDDQENRDWFDDLLTLIRLTFFFALLYFNSSPLRCLTVIVIAGAIYLYHIGVLRLRHERNNNDLNRNNNAAQNAAVDQIRQGVDQQQNAVAAAVQGGQEVNDINNAAEMEQHQDAITANADTPENAGSETMLSTIRTFVVTFFTSLLPETPAL